MPKVILGIKLYNSNEVAELLGVSLYTAQKYIKKGQIGSRVIGGRRMVSEEDLKKFLTSQ